MGEEGGGDWHWFATTSSTLSLWMSNSPVRLFRAVTEQVEVNPKLQIVEETLRSCCDVVE